MTPSYISGLDLGQSADFSALVVTEKTFHPDPDRAGLTLPHFAVRHLYRWPLKTPYPNVVAEVKELFAVPPLRGSTLVIDKTGVGAAVCDLFAVADIGADLRPYQITHGFTPGDGTVPKRDLVSAVQATLQSRRLAIAKALEFAAVLAKELETFRVKVTEDRNETFCLTAGTLVTTAAGPKPIEKVNRHDLTLTRRGWRRIMWAGFTKYADRLAEVRLSTGVVLRGTPDHRVWTENRGWVELGRLQEGDECLAAESPARTPPTAAGASLPKSSGSAGWSTGARRRVGITSARPARGPCCTARCGNSPTGPTTSPTGTTSTTRTRTPTTTTPGTWSALPTPSTPCGTSGSTRSNLGSARGAATRSPVVGSGPWCASIPGSGTVPLLASSSTARPGISSVPSAAGTSRPRGTAGTGRWCSTAPTGAGRPPGIGSDNCPPGRAPGAGWASPPSTRSASIAIVVAPPKIVSPATPLPVYDLSVEGDHEFFANGVLVHNSAWRERDHDDLVLALALAVWYGRPNDAGWPDGPPAAFPDPFAGVPGTHGRSGGSATGW